MSDVILVDFYNSLVDDEISKIIINSLNERWIENDEDFKKILENCLDLLEKAS